MADDQSSHLPTLTLRRSSRLSLRSTFVAGSGGGKERSSSTQAQPPATVITTAHAATPPSLRHTIRRSQARQTMSSQQPNVAAVPASRGPLTRSQSRKLSLLSNEREPATTTLTRPTKRPHVDTAALAAMMANNLVERFANPTMPKKKARIDPVRKPTLLRTHNRVLPNVLATSPSRLSAPPTFAPPSPRRADSGLDDASLPVAHPKPILKRTKTYQPAARRSMTLSSAVQFPLAPVTQLTTESDLESQQALSARQPLPGTFLARTHSARERMEKAKQMTQFKAHEMRLDPGARHNTHREWPLALPPPDVIRYGDLEDGQQRFGSRWYLDAWGPYCPTLATGVVEAGYAVHGMVQAAKGLAGRVVESVRLWRSGQA